MGPYDGRLLGFTSCPGSESSRVLAVVLSIFTVGIYCRRVWAVGDDQEVQHMEEDYTQLGTVLTDQRQANSEGDGVIVVGRFKGDPYDGVQLSYDAGRRNLYLTAEGALRLALLLAAAVERDIDIR